MKNYTRIPNEILDPNQLTLQAKLLLCVLLYRCYGDKEWCFPTQTALGACLGISARMVRTYIRELENNGLIYTVRTGFNRSNTYKVAKDFVYEEKGDSYHIGSLLPLHQGNIVPPNNLYRKRKFNKKIEEIKNDLSSKLSMDRIK